MTRERNQQTEAAILRCSSKCVFLKISQHPHEKHENICVRVSLECSCRAEGLQLYSKETPTQLFFPVNISKILRTPFL